MKITTILVLATSLFMIGASGAAAQNVDPDFYFDVNIGGQTQSVTLATSSTFSLFGETGATSSNVTVGRGLMFDAGAGYFVRKNFAAGAMVTVFTRKPAGTVSIAIPDPIAFGSPTVLSASPQLTQTEVGAHIKLAYRVPLHDKFDVVLSGGPSFVHLNKDIVAAAVTNGTPLITVATQSGSGVGAHGGVDLNYRFTPRLGGGLFARYIAAQVDLPAASGISVGGFQGGLGLRLVF
jgi:hypothetical protein